MITSCKEKNASTENSTLSENVCLQQSEAVVLEAFYLKDHYDKANFNDTLIDSIEIEIEKDNRQKFYDEVNSFGYYSTVVKPFLDSIDVKTIKIEENEECVILNGVNKKYRINLKKQKERMGIIFFNGKDKPFYWKGINQHGVIDAYLKRTFMEKKY